ncbi:MAG TPA: hypothetical protein PLI31_03590 [Methanoregulaceae archaeon]|nr:hypothetical protein [Methanoregulaceae archaeon]
MLHRNTMGGAGAADGISEVVGFVIILAVIVAGLSLYLVHGVPVLGREAEIARMDGVRGWFVDYKTSVDQLWLNSPAIPNNSTPYVPGDPDPHLDRKALFSISSGQMTLRRVINPGAIQEGGFIVRYLPMLAPIPASEEVSIRTDDTFTVSGWRYGREVLNWSNTSPALVYSSHNNYWLQQEYYYQLGGVFLRQWDPTGEVPEKVMVVLAPPLSIYSSDVGGTGYQTMAGLVVVNLTAYRGGLGARSPVRVETRLVTDPLPLVAVDETQPYEFSDVSLTFRAGNDQPASNQAALAWYTIFNGAAARNGLNTSYYNVSLSGPVARIEILGYEDNPNIPDVQFGALEASYVIKLENVPTIIE